MCVKLLLRNLNPSPFSPHPTTTYTYGVTVELRMCGGYYGPTFTSVNFQ